MTSRPAVLVAVHDGFYGCGTGAGRSNQSFLRTLAGLLAPASRLVVMPVRLSPASSEFDPDWHRQTLAIIGQAGGEVIPVDNGTGGMTRFGGLAHFRAACTAAAASITALQLPSRTLILASDAPFYGLAPLLSPGLRGCLVNVARSTAALHDPADTARITWERDGLQAAAAAGGRIAAISGHMRDHLAGSYHLPQAAIVNLTNGLTLAEQHHLARPGSVAPPPAARAGFLLAFGRAAPYKGFDDLLDALVILRACRRPVPPTILAAVTDGPPLTSYQRHLARRIQAEDLDVSLHTRYSAQIRGLLSHRALAAVIIPSRAEPSGRIPLEAFAAGASPVIATTAGGLAELVIDGHTGYTAAPASPPSLADAISRALAARTSQRAAMLAEGRRMLASRYTYDTNVQGFIRTMAPWALAAAQSG